MHPSLRSLLAALAGLVVATIAIAIVQFANTWWYPIDIDPADTRALAEAIANLPLGAYLGLIASYAIGSFAGGAVAGALANRMGAAIAVGVTLTVAGFSNLYAIPHPLWVAVATTLTYVPGAWLGARLLARV